MRIACASTSNTSIVLCVCNSKMAVDGLYSLLSRATLFSTPSFTTEYLILVHPQRRRFRGAVWNLTLNGSTLAASPWRHSQRTQRSKHGYSRMGRIQNPGEETKLGFPGSGDKGRGWMTSVQQRGFLYGCWPERPSSSSRSACTANFSGTDGCTQMIILPLRHGYASYTRAPLEIEANARSELVGFAGERHLQQPCH